MSAFMRLQFEPRGPANQEVSGSGKPGGAAFGCFHKNIWTFRPILRFAFSWMSNEGASIFVLVFRYFMPVCRLLKHPKDQLESFTSSPTHAPLRNAFAGCQHRSVLEVLCEHRGIGVWLSRSGPGYCLPVDWQRQKIDAGTLGADHHLWQQSSSMSFCYSRGADRSSRHRQAAQ